MRLAHRRKRFLFNGASTGKCSSCIVRFFRRTMLGVMLVPILMLRVDMMLARSMIVRDVNLCRWAVSRDYLLRSFATAHLVFWWLRLWCWLLMRGIVRLD